MEKPNTLKNLERKDILTIAITGVIVGLLAGATAYLYLGIAPAIIIGLAGGLLSGVGVNWVRRNLLSEVVFPSVKSLAGLTLYSLVVFTVLALVMLGLDLLFVRIRGLIL